MLFSESFVFTECFLTFPFAYALAGAGVLFWVRRKYVPAVLCLIGAAGFYQIALIAAAKPLLLPTPQDAPERSSELQPEAAATRFCTAG